MRDNQVDTCRKNCGGGCEACSKKHEVDFRPVDIRLQYMAGGADPKLDGVN